MIKFILWPLMAFTFVSSQMAPKYKEATTKATYEEKTKAYEEKTKAYGQGLFNFKSGNRLFSKNVK